MSYSQYSGKPPHANVSQPQPLRPRPFPPREILVTPDEAVLVASYLGQPCECSRGSLLRRGDRISHAGSRYEVQWRDVDGYIRAVEVSRA